MKPLEVTGYATYISRAVQVWKWAHSLVNPREQFSAFGKNAEARSTQHFMWLWVLLKTLLLFNDDDFV